MHEDMRILAPLGSPDALDPLCDAGADELYLGFHDQAWSARFGGGADLNRMSGFGAAANPSDFEDALAVVERAHGRGRHAFIALNAATYTSEQLAWIEERYLARLAEVACDGVIVSDLVLARLASETGVPAVASTMCDVRNADIARLMLDAGIRRLIVPRDLSLVEIDGICTAVAGEAQVEAFLMRNGCVFSDAHCLGLHGPVCGSVCEFMRRHRTRPIMADRSFREMVAADQNCYLYDTAFHKTACGLCALWRLRAVGVTSLKVVGRANALDGLCRDIALICRNLQTVGQSLSEGEFLDRMELPVGFPSLCRFGMSCYYPEVRFHEVA